MLETLAVQGLWMDLNKREKWVGIIGSRNASDNEKKKTREFAYHCAKAGYIVVSGLALGMDTEAHWGAIEAGGKTIAIVNTPLHQAINPSSNRELANEIKKNGCIIHPYQTTDEEADALFGKEKGVSRYTKRLWERDVLLAHFCPKIVPTKESEEMITGGTRWAVNYGKIFEKEVLRLDGNGKLRKNVLVEEAKVWWAPEMEYLKEILTK